MEVGFHVAIVPGCGGVDSSICRLASYDRDAGAGASDSSACNLVHGVVEGQAKHAHKEVDGIARQIALRPAPVAVLD